MVESLSLEGFKRRGDVALLDMVTGRGGDGLTVGLEVVSGLFQPACFYDCIDICCVI